MKFSQLLIEIRGKLNLTQEELAKKMDVSFATINRWENSHWIPSKRHQCVLKNICIENKIDYKKYMEEI